MTPTIQDTLLQLFDNVRQDPDTIPTEPVDRWQEGSVEWSLLSSFHGMLEQVQQRMHQFKQMEQQLREKEEQYRSIFEAVTDSLTISSLEDGQVVEANPATCKMLGYSYEELIGKLPSDLVPPDNLSFVTEGLQTLSAGGRNDLVMLTLRKNGTSFPTEVHSTQFTYKGKPHLLTVARDISERIQAEQQLREKEEQYRSIFEASADGLFIVDLDDSHSVEVNPMACKMFGYTHEEMLGRTVRISDDTQQIPLHAHEIIRAGGQFQMRDTTSRKDGTSFNAEVRATPFIYKGKPHLLAIVRDITEQFKAEEQLREKEEQYRSIFEATYDAMTIYDLDGYYVEVNPAMCRMFGYTREELIGVHASILFPPERHPDVAYVLESLKVGKEYQGWTKCLRKDGTLFYGEAHGTTFTYRGKPHGLGILRDTSEQVQAKKLLEQRVEERTRELSSLLEISHTVASTLQLDPLLGLILDQLKTVVDYTGSAILVVEGENLIILDNRSPIQEVQLMQLRFRLKEQVIGMLVLTSSKEEAFKPHHATLALAIADQAAVAIENARLYEQAQELAAIEERQRLARELHDSVSQALYGISLGVHTARMQLDRNPKELAESLDYVLELAEAALIEMRALIFELRPESLETEGLVTALTKQAAALHARQGILVQLNLCQEPGITLKVKQYR